MAIDISFSPEVYGNCDNPTELILSKIRNRSNKHLFISKSFIDARRKDNVKLVFRVEMLSNSEIDSYKKSNELAALPLLDKSVRDSSNRPIIVGFGPAGMFCALILARYGLKPIVIEKGSSVDKRQLDVKNYRLNRNIDTNSNIQFGEGGAGTFSDGKLYTGVSSGLKGFIADTMIKHGAPEDICYDSHPHVGTDNLVNVVKGIRNEIISLGGDVLFDTTLTDLIVQNNRIVGIKTNDSTISSNCVVLAIGHSSRETIKMIHSKNILMENKPFSVGVRIEHLRENIDKAQYGFDTALYKNIFAANYKLAVDTVTNRKLYTFCMCPGGEVIAAASEKEAICTNGMSYRARNGVNSNSALLVPVDSNVYGEGVLDGIYFQEELERKAFIVAGSNYNAPFMYYGTLSRNGSITKSVAPSYIPGVSEVDFNDIFPQFIVDSISDGICKMGRKIKGFDSPDAVLTGVEARSSSSVRIIRNRETFVSESTDGLYPIGEGAGYAGGIMSSAIDGIKCANRIAENMLN